MRGVMRIGASALLLLSLLAAVVLVRAQEFDEPAMGVSLVEVGAASTISSTAARPLQDIAQLLVDASNTMRALRQSRDEYQVLSNHVRVRQDAHVTVPAAKPKKTEHVNAELIPRMQQPLIHNPNRFGTHHPILPDHEWVDADIVGEDGKPYKARPSFGVDEPRQYRSPFAKFVYPPKVGSSADVTLKDSNTRLTDTELKAVNDLQKRLLQLLKTLGSNIVWDHTTVANRRLTQEFEALKVEARTLMEEYELRTGVKTIAWQLFGSDPQGFSVPVGRVKDIYFAKNPELAGRKLQRPGDPKGPPKLTKKQLKESRAYYGEKVKNQQEQRVNVEWKKQKDGTVKAKVNLQVVDSKQPAKDQSPNLRARRTVKGKKLPSGRKLPDSRAVQVDVVAPGDEHLERNRHVADKPKIKRTKGAKKAAAKRKQKRAKKVAKKVKKVNKKKAAKKASKKKSKKAKKLKKSSKKSKRDDDDDDDDKDFF